MTLETQIYISVVRVDGVSRERIHVPTLDNMRLPIPPQVLAIETQLVLKEKFKKLSTIIGFDMYRRYRSGNEAYKGCMMFAASPHSVLTPWSARLLERRLLTRFDDKDPINRFMQGMGRQLGMMLGFSGLKGVLVRRDPDTGYPTDYHALSRRDTVINSVTGQVHFNPRAASKFSDAAL